MSSRVRRSRLPTLIVLTFMAGGCTEPSPTGVIPEEPAAFDIIAAHHVQPPGGVPLRVRAGATLVGQDFAPGFGPPTFGRSTFDGRCSAPADFVIRFAVEGEATHLGRFTASAEHCSQIDFAAGRTSAITDGVLTYTAANGDELWSRYQRGLDPAEHHEFVGGTGRFTGASGDGTAHVACNQATGTCVFELDGLLHFDASDRRR